MLQITFSFEHLYDQLSKTYLINPSLPLIGGGRKPFGNLASVFINLGDVVSALLPYVYVIAGLILFGFLVIGGFGLLTSAGNPDSVKKAQSKITSALIGFIIIFLSYWLAQILQIIFKIQIL